MTEEEKLLTGKIFCPYDPELVAIKRIAHNACTEFNRTFEDEAEKRNGILKKLLKSVGTGCYFQGPIYFNYGSHTSIGDNFFGNYNIMISDDAYVSIGHEVMFGPNVTLATPLHPLIAGERRSINVNGKIFQPCYAKPITIGDDVWLSAGVTVCGGVTIGHGSVIGANSVVTRDIPENVFAAGNPCRVIRPIDDSDSIINRQELWEPDDQVTRNF